MTIELPSLPYARDALQPHLSMQALDEHHGKRHKGYVDRLNVLIKGGAFEDQPLENIVRQASGTIFNCAAQAWNHNFYWRCLSPEGGEPEGKLADAIAEAFGTLDHMKQRFTQTALANFGSGWVWLVQRPDRHLAIVSTRNSGTPLTGDDRPLLACSVWEHAYYTDYQDDRARYLEAFWKLVDWTFVFKQMR